MWGDFEWFKAINLEYKDKNESINPKPKEISEEEKRDIINKLKDNDIELEKDKPTPAEFLYELKSKKPHIYKELIEHKFKGEDQTSITNYLRENITTLYYSKIQDKERNYVTDHSWITIPTAYDNSDVFYLTDEWNIVEMSSTSPDFEDSIFVWYWIWWKNEDR